MITTKFFIDEKFKDTIKKNSCRLRQKSSVQVSCFIINKVYPDTILQRRMYISFYHPNAWRLLLTIKSSLFADMPPNRWDRMLKDVFEKGYPVE